jgi:hypothetical protein
MKHAPTLMAFLASALLCLALYWLYVPGIHGPFLVDDIGTIVGNPLVQPRALSVEALLQAAFSSQAGPLGRPLPMASFAIDFAMGGLMPEPFKRTNIILHLIITLLVFAVSKALLERLYGKESPSNWQAPLMAAALWALHPLHVSTVLYAVQRMSQLTMLFIMAALWVYVDLRNRLLAGDARGSTWRAVLFIPPLFAGALFSKENGALLPLLLLVVESIFFRFAMPARLQISRLLLVVLLVLPTLALLGYLISLGLGVASVGNLRDFSPAERMLTEPRLLLTYLTQFFWPDPAGMPFYFDNVIASRGLLDPTATLGAIALCLLLLGAALACVWHGRAPLFAFAVLWFFGAHLLESTTVPLELGFEHRNYLPVFGFTFSMGVGLWQFTRQPGHWPRLGKLLLIGIPVILVWQLHQRVTAWSSAESFFAHTLNNVPTSARAWGDYSHYLTTQGRLHEAIQPLMKAAALNPHEAGYLMVAINLTVNAFGEEPEPALVQETLTRLKTYPLSAYGNNILSILVNPLIEQTITPAGKRVLKQLLEAAAGNPGLKPGHRKLITLALIVLAQMASSQKPEP